jgi:hypothetical protein
MRTRSQKNWRRSLATIALALAVWGPTGSQAWASDGHGGEKPPAESAEADESDDVSEESATGTRAIKLGEFSIRVFHGASSRKDTVSFILHATVGKDEYPTFVRFYSHHKNKVRDQVIVATRLVPIDDYDDPELKKFRRRILLRIRRAMPELPIEEIYLSDFSLSSEST